LGQVLSSSSIRRVVAWATSLRCSIDTSARSSNNSSGACPLVTATRAAASSRLVSLVNAPNVRNRPATSRRATDGRPRIATSQRAASAGQVPQKYRCISSTRRFRLASIQSRTICPPGVALPHLPHFFSGNRQLWTRRRCGQGCAYPVGRMLITLSRSLRPRQFRLEQMTGAPVWIVDAGCSDSRLNIEMTDSWRLAQGKLRG
jgi:hypothetical protein